MKVTVNKETCIGCGSCVAICPAIFELKEGKSVVKKQPSSEKEESCVKDAVEACPVDAIKIS
ncbi:ferredoxin [Nanoarchaeota archaeon]|nr:MAG: ferredoxin [Nanoarchaeota archaeon]